MVVKMEEIEDKELMEIKKKKMEEIIRKQNDWRIKLKDFANAIVESEEYRNFVECDEKLKMDKTAQNFLRQFRQKQMELQWGWFNSKTFEELRDLQMKINENETIQKFVKSQQEIVNILQVANNIISVKVGTQFALSQGGGCCG